MNLIESKIFTEVNTLKYKNVSRGIKKFRGVTFKPGETKSVNGFINDPKMIRVDEPEPKAQTTKAATPKAADQKAEVKSNG